MSPSWTIVRLKDYWISLRCHMIFISVMRLLCKNQLQLHIKERRTAPPHSTHCVKLVVVLGLTRAAWKWSYTALKCKIYQQEKGVRYQCLFSSFFSHFHISIILEIFPSQKCRILTSCFNKWWSQVGNNHTLWLNYEYVGKTVHYTLGSYSWTFEDNIWYQL